MNSNIKDMLLKDNRLYVDERNLNRLMSEAQYSGYSVADIKVDNILRSYNGKIYSLRETRVYSY